MNNNIEQCEMIRYICRCDHCTITTVSKLKPTITCLSKTYLSNHLYCAFCEAYNRKVASRISSCYYLIR